MSPKCEFQRDGYCLQQEKMWDLDYCEEYLRSISNKILLFTVAVLRKASSHSVVICRLIKKLIM